MKKLIISIGIAAVCCLPFKAFSFQQKIAEQDTFRTDIAVLTKDFVLHIGEKQVKLIDAVDPEIRYMKAVNGFVYAVIDVPDSIRKGMKREGAMNDPRCLLSRHFLKVDVENMTLWRLGVADIFGDNGKVINTSFMLETREGRREVKTGKALYTYHGWVELITAFMLKNDFDELDYYDGNTAAIRRSGGLLLFCVAANALREFKLKSREESFYAQAFFCNDGVKLAYVHHKGIDSAQISTDVIIYDMDIKKYMKRFSFDGVAEAKLSTDGKLLLLSFRNVKGTPTNPVLSKRPQVVLFNIKKDDKDNSWDGISACWLD